jgi:arylsulfatase A-like enzyme
LRGADNALPHDYVCPQAWRTAVPEELYPTTYVEREAISFLEQRAAADDPFFLQVSFPDPHHPFTPPGKFWDLYDPADVTLPESFLDVTNQPPPHVEWARAQRDAGTAVRNLPSCFAVTEREAREAIALSCGMITMIDDAVGRILAGLSRFGLADDTVIMFTTDHGDFLGDHQMLLKGPMHYQGLVRVPFIWCDPANAAAGDRRDDLSGTVDIAPTILERAKIVPFNGIQGQSLFAADSAGTDTGRDALLIEEDGQRAYLGFDLPVRCRTLVTEGHRLTIYHGVDWGELYDLDADPGEMVNSWDDPGHARIQSELTERLARALMATDDRSPYPTNLA